MATDRRDAASARLRQVRAPQPPDVSHDQAADTSIVPRDPDLADLQAKRGKRLLVDLGLEPTVPGPHGTGPCQCYGLLPRRQPPRARKRQPLVRRYLTPAPAKRRRRERETPEKLAGASRFLQGAARNAAGDVEVLPLLAALHGNVDQALAEVVHQARQAGHSWAEIGQRLGMTRQSAWERFGP
jgi:hypothetical protein